MPLKTHRDEPPALNLTPMIDVVFLLIIFFMVGTKFAELERKIALQVPKVADVQALSPAPEKRVINVHQDGRLALDGEEVTLEELGARLSDARRGYRDLGVVVRGDAQGAFQNVATVLAVCRKAGIAEMGISVRMAERTARRE